MLIFTNIAVSEGVNFSQRLYGFVRLRFALTLQKDQKTLSLLKRPAWGRLYKARLA